MRMWGGKERSTLEDKGGQRHAKHTLHSLTSFGDTIHEEAACLRTYALG